MHGMVVDPGESAYQEQYAIHPTKNGVLLCNNGVRTTSNYMGFNMGEKQSSVNVSLYRGIKQTVNIVEKISLGRKTAYALIDADLHSGNGLTKPLCAYLWSTYLIQRLVYALKVKKLSRKDLEGLEKFQRKCLRKIQGLTDRTPNCVTHSFPIGDSTS